MEELNKRFTSAQKALNKLKEDIELIESDNPNTEKFYEQFRRAAIQSFECSIDTLWKAAKEYLLKKEGIELNAPTPKGVFRECYTIKLINQNEFESISLIIADRNQTSHSYNEQVAEEISTKLSEHYILMKKILDRINIAKLN